MKQTTISKSSVPDALLKNLSISHEDFITGMAARGITIITAEERKKAALEKYTLEICKASALNYKTISKWKLNDCGAFLAAKRNKWIPQCSAHFITTSVGRKKSKTRVVKPIGYWTLERLQEDALKYNTRSEWERYSPSAYSIARNHKLINFVCRHMKKFGITFHTCRTDAIKCKSRYEWRSRFQGTYNKAREMNWLDKLCSNMINNGWENLPRKKYVTTTYKHYKHDWTLDFCLQDAIKYKTPKEWKDAWHGTPRRDSIFSHARKHGWLKQCYTYIKSGGKFIDHQAKVKSKPMGYWTLEKLKEDASKYKTRSAWRAKSNSAYNAARGRRANSVARKEGWFDLCCCNMIETKKPKGFYTLERCKEDALKYPTRIKWTTASPRFYNAAHKHGWLELCIPQSNSNKKPKGYWDVERCKADAMQYSSPKEWRENSCSAYVAASVAGWLDLCYAPHWSAKQPPVDLGVELERCKVDAMQYRSRKEWSSTPGSCWNIARKRGWVKICCEYFIKPEIVIMNETTDESVKNELIEMKPIKPKSNMLKELNILVASMNDDAIKWEEKGNKEAAKRLRKALQAVRKLATRLRKEIQEQRKIKVGVHGNTGLCLDRHYKRKRDAA